MYRQNGRIIVFELCICFLSCLSFLYVLNQRHEYYTRILHFQLYKKLESAESIIKLRYLITVLGMGSRYLKEVEWQILHAINIYVYRNGKDGEQPILVHIPPERKKNMKSIMKAVQERVSFPIGYAIQLYSMDGNKVRQAHDLVQYQSYVAASNYDKHFISTQYGRKRLLLLSKDSKHIRYGGREYHERMLKKKLVGEEIPECIFYNPKFNDKHKDTQEIPNNFRSRPDTFRPTTQTQHYQNRFEEFLISTSPITNIQRPSKNIKNSQSRSRMKLSNSNNNTSEARCQPTSRGMEAKSSNVINSDYSSEFEAVTISNSSSNQECEKIDNTLKKTKLFENLKPNSNSDERLRTTFFEIFKQAKTGRWKTEEEGSKSNYSILTNPSKKCKNRSPNGKQMLVIPPPPPEFRDGSNNASKNMKLRNGGETYRKSDPLAEAPFILLEGQTRPLLRTAVAQREITTACTLTKDTTNNSQLSVNNYDRSSESRHASRPITNTIKSDKDIITRNLSSIPNNGLSKTGSISSRFEYERPITTNFMSPKGDNRFESSNSSRSEQVSNSRPENIRPITTTIQLGKDVSRNLYNMTHSGSNNFETNNRRNSDRKINRFGVEKVKDQKLTQQYKMYNAPPAFQDISPRHRDSRNSFQFKESQPSHETFIIHRRHPQKPEVPWKSGSSRHQTPRTSYPEDILHRTLTPRRPNKPARAKLIIRNGYVSS